MDYINGLIVHYIDIDDYHTTLMYDLEEGIPKGNGQPLDDSPFSEMKDSEIYFVRYEGDYESGYSIEPIHKADLEHHVVLLMKSGAFMPLVENEFEKLVN